MIQPFGTTRGGVAIGTHDGNALGHFQSDGVAHGTEAPQARTKKRPARNGNNLAMNRDGSVTFASVFTDDDTQAHNG